MERPHIEVGDIIRAHGPSFREANAGHLSLGQLKVMSALERCRTAALGGHVLSCTECSHAHIAYNSCRNRHCPKCQAKAAKDWLAAREAELLPVPYFHVVFTMPSQLGRIAYQNKAIVYRALFQAAAEALLTLGADPKRYGAKLGMIGVLHTWGEAMAWNYPLWYQQYRDEALEALSRYGASPAERQRRTPTEREQNTKRGVTHTHTHTHTCTHVPTCAARDRVRTCRTYSTSSESRAAPRPKRSACIHGDGWGGP